jgi:hypothetical protein
MIANPPVTYLANLGKKKKKKKYCSIVQNYDLRKKKVPENLSKNNLKFSPNCERTKRGPKTG